MKQTYCLIVTCPDRPGIVAAVTSFMAEHGGTITEANQYTDPTSGCFFMRYMVAADSLPFDAAGFAERFEPIADEFAMSWRITDSAVPRKVLLMVSKQDHCLADLLYRWKSQDIRCEIPAVISNHEDLRDYVEWHQIPFHHVPVPGDDEGKQTAFNKTAELIDQYQPDTIVLARYMQILPDWMCQRYPSQVINIHHSFLPSFVGAKPYHQAQERGVKLTGATCHYVTAELDAGPIIEQDVARINHHDAIDEIIRLGKDVEKTVLARGLKYHLEDRVLVHGNKTIVFA